MKFELLINLLHIFDLEEFRDVTQRCQLAQFTMVVHQLALNNQEMLFFVNCALEGLRGDLVLNKRFSKNLF